MRIHPKLAIFSWGMYDFANTIFSMNVITLYFALWVTVDMQSEDIFYSLALSGSMLIGALVAPILGAISDRIGRRLPFLIVFTTLCCIFTAFISMSKNLFLGLLLFAIANFTYQIADTFYNALLVNVSNAKNRGKISGFGISLGYFGTITGLLLVGPFALHYGRHVAFVLTAGIFFLFALPCFIFVKDKKETLKSKEQLAQKSVLLGKAGFIQVKNSLKNIKKYRNLFYFLLALFIAFNAINTIYIFMSVFTKKVLLFSDQEIILFYVVSSIFAIFGSFAIGYITDKWGAKKTLSAILILWCVIIFLAAIVTYKKFFWVLGPLAGISFGGTWTSSRALAIQLAPKHKVGEVFGFYGLVGKTASIFGPMVWGLSTFLLGGLGILKYRISIALLLVFLIVSIWLLKSVKTMG